MRKISNYKRTRTYIMENYCIFVEIMLKNTFLY